MATLKIKLPMGYKFGKSTLFDVELREPTAGDVIEANEASEKLVYIPDDAGQMQPTFLASPTLVGVNVLCRQIVKIGDIDGPLSLAQLKKLHPLDLDAIQEKANEMEAAWAADIVAKGAANRGRDHQPGAGNK